MILKIIPLFFIMDVSQSSMVIDSYSQKGIYVSDYCPHMEHCAEGSHVMCMYYDPSRTMGPRCSNPQKVSITPDLANQLLEIINAIRSKVANGKESGKDNVMLPRGYGIFRLKWDNELATFAQVLANQCVLVHDLCRATKKFSDPGQTAGLVRFTFPDWKPMSSHNMTPGLNDDKLSFTVTQTLKSWYSQKTSVTEKMINSYPDWEANLTLGGRLYLEIIHGSTTHMGCGMSAYTEFIYYQGRATNRQRGGINYNSILMICNFSSRPKTGERIYFPTRPPYTSPCGCPEGTTEDADCLCNEGSHNKDNTKLSEIGIQTDPETCPNPENNCEPTLVLLPIFTVEDAPPDRLISRAKDIEEPLATYVLDRMDNRTNMIGRTKSLEIFDFFEDARREQNVRSPAAVPHPLQTVLMASDLEPVKRPKTTPTAISLPVPTKRRPYGVRPQYPRTEPESEPEPRQIPQAVRPPPRHVPTSKKSSIFTRVAKFKLPSGKKSFGPFDMLKPEVKPRKDFKNIQKVVNDYIKRRNNQQGYRRHDVIVNNHERIRSKAAKSTTPKAEDTTEMILNKAEEKVMDFDQYLKHKNNVSVDENTKHFDVKYEESDNKLMTLLDTLEREVKHIELDGDEKEIFDAKIRKIYGSVVGKPKDLFVLDKFKSKPSHLTQKPTGLSHVVDREPDIPEADFGESKTYIKHESNHVTDDDLRRHEPEHLTDDERNINKEDIEKQNKHGKYYDNLDRKYRNKSDRKYKKNSEDKYGDIFDNNKSFNDNDMFDNDQKIYSDIERKYNSRIANNYGMSKIDHKYDDDDLEHPVNRKRNDLSHKYSNMASRSQNNLGKYENIRHSQNSGEERKHRGSDKYRERESRGGSQHDKERNFFRNNDDERKRKSDSKRNKNFHLNKEFERDDPLSIERRKYYQEKLENLERRLHNSRSYRHRKTGSDDRDSERQMRRLRPNMNHEEMEVVRPRSKAQGDSFYMPDRARFLHGF